MRGGEWLFMYNTSWGIKHCVSNEDELKGEKYGDLNWAGPWVGSEVKELVQNKQRDTLCEHIVIFKFVPGLLRKLTHSSISQLTRKLFLCEYIKGLCCL